MAATACSVLTVGALLCNPPIVPSPLTLHGAPLPSAVDIYRLAAPVAAPVVESVVEQDDPQPPARSRAKGFIWIGALIGAGAGCPIGVHLNRRSGSDDAQTFACFFMAGVGTGIGALAVATAVL